MLHFFDALLPRLTTLAGLVILVAVALIASAYVFDNAVIAWRNRQESLLRQQLIRELDHIGSVAGEDHPEALVVCARLRNLVTHQPGTTWHQFIESLRAAHGEALLKANRRAERAETELVRVKGQLVRAESYTRRQ